MIINLIFYNNKDEIHNAMNILVEIKEMII